MIEEHRNPPRTLAIVNPASQSGKTGRIWPRVREQLIEKLGPLDCEMTRGPRDAIRISREGARAGIERILVAGGDGTLNEVVNGVLDSGLGERVELGVLPFGTGGDWARTMNSLEEACSGPRTEGSFAVDAGRVTIRAADGNEQVRYFLNIASCGSSGLTAKFANESSKKLGGKIAFILASLRTIAVHAGAEVRLRIDGELVFEGDLSFAAMANGQFFGGGMHVAPNAALDDGLLDIIIVPHMSRFELLRAFPSLHSGRHLQHPLVRHFCGKCIEVEADSDAVFIESDGESIGALPAKFEVLPKALRFMELPLSRV